MFRKSVLSVVLGIFVASCLMVLQGRVLLAQNGATVVNDVNHDQSAPLGEMSASAVQDGGEPRMIPLRHRMHKARQGQIDPVVQSSAGPLVSATPASAFGGVGANGSAPPDSNGAVGATQYVEWVNSEFAVYDKATGALVYGPVAGNTLWSGFGGPCQDTNDGDPIAQYDKAANRWVMTQLGNVSFGPPFYSCVAVSTTSDATGSYYRYAFSFNDLNDYTKLSVWPDGYYLSANMFHKLTGGSFSFAGPQACALNRAAMLAGRTATMQCVQLTNFYYSLLPSDLDGSTPPPAGSPNYYVSLDSNSLNLWKFHVDWTTPGNSTLTGPTNMPVAAFNEGCNGGVCIPQGGTTQQLDSLGDRLMYRLAYRNLGSRESLVVNHSVTAGSVVGLRWYEIRSPGGTPTVYQQGTFAPSDGNYRWMGSIAMDQSGDVALGYNVSGSNMHPAIRYTGRVPSDPLGAMEAESNILQGAGSQTGGLTRWGDYSSMSIDPVDDCTFWYVNQYIPSSGAFNWATHIYSFKFASCGPTAAPAAPTGLVATPGNAQVSLSWNSSSGAATYNVLRSTTSGGPYSMIATDVASTSLTNTGLSNGTAYYYVVQAVNSAGTSSNSNQAGATPVCSLPGVPAGLSATPGNAQVSLSWAAASGATSYNVKRSTTSGSGYATIANVTSTSYTNIGLTNGTTYYYVVSAACSCGEGANSSQVTAKPQAPTAPAAPTALQASQATSAKRINLRWTQSTSSGVSQNKVYRSTTSGGTYALVGTVSATTSYSDGYLNSGQTYYYVVTAVSGSGTSAYSNQASARAK